MMSLRRTWLILMVAAAVIGFLRLRFQTDPLDLLPADLPAVKGLKWQQEHLINPDETLITISATPEQAEAAAESLTGHLAAQEGVSSCRWRRDLQENATFVADMAAYLWLNGSPEEFSQLTNRFAQPALTERLREVTERLAVTLSPEEIARLSFDPLGLLDSPAAKRLLSARSFDPFQSENGEFRVIRVKPKAALSDHWACIEWIQFLREEVDQWREDNPDWATVVGPITGRPAFVAESASSMEKDMERAIPMTACFVGILFLLVHRRVRPVLALVALLTVVLVMTMAMGGLFFGTLNAISLGFAAILLGVCADYALVLYAEYEDTEDIATARTAAGRGVAWSAWTTAMAFGSLVFGGLPGLGQLGLLVATGVLFGAVAFLNFFLGRVGLPDNVAKKADLPELGATGTRMGLGVLMLSVVAILAMKASPGFTTNGKALQSPDSQAMAGVREISKRMVGNADGWLLFVSATNHLRLESQLEELADHADTLQREGQIEGYMLPRGIVANEPAQARNRELLRTLITRNDTIKRAVMEAGFDADGLALQQSVFQAWGKALKTEGVWLPSSIEAQELVRQAGWRDGNGIHVAGWLDPVEGTDEIASRLSREGTIVASWSLLGEEVWERVDERLTTLLLVVFPLVLLSLWCALGRLAAVLSCVLALVLGLATLLAAMSLLGWQWNLINVAALPVLLGLGVDYSIHLQLARRRHAGALRRAWNTTGRAILLCAATSLAAFGSLALASNPVLSEFGRVCAFGVIAMWLSSNLLVFSGIGNEATREITGPSSSYGAVGWRIGLFLIRGIPRGLAMWIAECLTFLYARFRPERFAVVANNLAPLARTNDSTLLARRLFRRFGRKLVDLWRFEAGCSMKERFGAWQGWEALQFAHARGTGVLLVTIHLGNWELGSDAIKSKGMDLVVLSNPEPDPRLTEMREAARRRMGIETIIVGDDPFAFVEVIKRLREGAAVALLLDRPAPATATTVDLLGRPFQASIGPAELARASGATILPVVIVEDDDRYSAKVLQQIDYDRATLRDPAERAALTQQLLRAFEPVLQQYPDQWYHFVPIWPEQ